MGDVSNSAGPVPRSASISRTSVFVLGGVVVGLAFGQLAQPRRLGAQSDLDVSKHVILRFGSHYINANSITHVRLSIADPTGKTLVYFTGDNRAPLELTREEGEMMRPWLDGHALDLTARPDPNALPKIRALEQ